MEKNVFKLCVFDLYVRYVGLKYWHQPPNRILQTNSSQKDWSKLDLIASVRRSKEEYLRKLNLARDVQKSDETKQKQNIENIVIPNNHKNKDYVSNI